ncbi:MAG: hypothetical protein methR_P3819 [Methyloprofundus sp.]|nr:MAG: hypothetical protein methR_P3819 [Methyloprofundus sp.]
MLNLISNISYLIILKVLKLALYLPLFIIFFFCLSKPSWAEEDLFQERSLRTGIYLQSFPDISLQDMQTAMQYWTQEIAEYSGIKGQVYFYKDLQRMRTDFYRGKINFILTSPLNIINHFDLQQFSDGYLSVMYGTPTDQLVVLSGKNSGINNMTDCKGKHLTLLNNDPVSEMYADILMLQAFGKPAKSIFKKIEYIHKSNQQILKLFFKTTDVILAYKNFYALASELNPQIKATTQIIATLDGMPRGMGLFHKNVPVDFREQVLSILFTLDTHIKGRQLLTMFYSDKLIRANIDALAPVLRLKQQYLQLLKQRSK